MTEEQHEKHKAYCKDYHKRTYSERRERKNAQTRERRARTNWYENNKEEIKARARAYYHAHKDEQRLKNRQHTIALRKMVLQHYGGKCAC